jgi:hypothetical protein
MHKSNVSNLLLMVLLSSCANAIVVRNKHSNYHLDIPKAYRSKDISFTAYSLSKSDKQIAIRKNQELERIVMSKGKNFNSLNTKTFLSDSSWFDVSKGSENFEKFLSSTRENGKYDYFLDVHTERKLLADDYGILWYMLHIVSLGFIPIYQQTQIHIKTTLFDKQGNVLNSSKVVHTRSFWAWTPLMVSSRAKKINSDELNDEMLDPSVNKVLSKTFIELK